MRDVAVASTGSLLAASVGLPRRVEGRQFTGRERARPSMFLTLEPVPGLRSLDQVRRDLKSGRTAELWNTLVAAAERDLDARPLTPSSLFPGRSEGAARHANPDYTVCHEVGQRILRAALVSLVTEDEQYKSVALRQMAALFDEKVWPPWIDQAHTRFGHPVDLRTGMLAHDLGIAFDWLVPLLSDEEQAFIIEGLDRRAIQPYRVSLTQDPWWTHDLNNWLTVIVGGLGVLGMSLGDRHPDSAALVEYALPKMEAYLGSYGPEGEFNESVAYANATRLPAAFYLARYYFTEGQENKLTAWPFPQTCEWTMYVTLPPGRVAAFGDSKADQPPETRHFATIASATRNPVLQWFYAQHARPIADPLEFIFYDPTVPEESPAGKMPLGRAYHGHGATISSRTDWNPALTACVVYGKAGREENHEHNDVGQLCVDGYGERLIIDTGSPSGYPEDFFEQERWQYYNASVIGHNVLMFGDREMRTIERDRGESHGTGPRDLSGKILDARFDDRLGAAWCLDLTPAYGHAKAVRRTVLHLLPGIVLVYDTAELASPEKISLRWHASAFPQLAGHHSFSWSKGNAALSGRLARLDADALEVAIRRHEYKAPFDRDRLGEPLEQRREPFIEAVCTAKSCSILTMFAVSPAGQGHSWIARPGTFEIETGNGRVSAGVSDSLLWARDAKGRELYIATC